MSSTRSALFHLLVIVLACCWLYFQQVPHFFDDPGVGWHLKTGEYVLQTASIPKIDPFLFSDQSRSWISDQWLSDAGFYVLWSVGSWPLLLAVGVILYLITFFIVLKSCLNINRVSTIPALIALLLCSKLALVHFIFRPVLIGIFCFAVLMFLLLRLRQANAYSKTPIYCATVILFALWPLLHPSFPLGLALLVCMAIGQALDAKLRPAFFIGPRWSGCLSLFFISFLVSLVNPYGFKLHESIFSLGSSQYFMRLHTEWLPPSLSSNEGQLYLIILSLVLIAAVFAREFWQKISAFEVIAFLAFALLGYRMLRGLPFFAVASVTLLGLALHSVLNRLALRKSESFSHVDQRNSKLAVALCVFLPLFVSWALKDFLALPLGPSARIYPKALLAELGSISREGEIRLASTPDWGGYITFFAPAGVRALIDDRNTLIGEVFHQSWMRALAGGPSWQGYFMSKGATHLLIPRKSPLADLARKSSGLRLLREDEIGLLFQFS